MYDLMYSPNYPDMTPKPPVHDEWSGRYFAATIADIERAVLNVNAFLVAEGELDLNTFYDRVGLAPLPMGSNFGWNQDRTPRFDVRINAMVMPNGWPALTMSFLDDPQPELGR